MKPLASLALAILLAASTASAAQQSRPATPPPAPAAPAAPAATAVPAPPATPPPSEPLPTAEADEGVHADAQRAAREAELSAEALRKAAEEAEVRAREARQRAEEMQEEAERTQEHQAERAEEAAEDALERVGDIDDDDYVVKSKDLVIGADQVMTRDIVNFGGNTTIEGKVRGDVASFGGTVRVRGEISGNVVAFGGPLILERGARVHGDAIAFGDGIDKADGAEVDGELINVSGAVGSAISSIAQKLVRDGKIRVGDDDHGRRDWKIEHRDDNDAPSVPWPVRMSILLGWLILGVILLALAPAHVRATAQELTSDPGRSALVGFAGVAAIIVVSGILCITIIGIPLALVLWAFMLFAYIFAGVTLYYAVGSRVLASIGRSPTLIVSFFFGWLMLGIFKCIPWVGALIWALLCVPAFGAVLSTKFGSNRPWMKRPIGATPPPPPPALSPDTLIIADNEPALPSVPPEEAAG